ncbi:MAG: hypothetical protein QOG89_1202 [Thermomicrobiales bacterium]|nr:hypothetical protein [Thermomicrobiales bacterium]
MTESSRENDPRQSTQASQAATGTGGVESPPIVIEVPGPTVNPVMERFWAAVRRLPRYVFLGTNLVRDDRVPRKVKATIAVGGAYAISPIDLVPGIIPVAGQLDDLVVLLLSLRQAIRSCPPEVAEEHLSRAGLSQTDFETDLRAVRDTAVWLAQKGIRATGKLAARGGRRLRALLPHR